MSLHYRLRLLALLCSPVLASETFAAQLELPTDEQVELQQLLALLEEQTTIATKTRLNSDYVPGMVTVLHGDKLEGTGARTVWEALARVPGIELSIEETGRKQIVVRGIGRTYASGNIKIMLNGVAMNSAAIAYANPVLNIPIEQVDRIEVIRGPGSAIHGEFAYTGVINVITRSDDKRGYARSGQGKHIGAGIVYSYNNEEKELGLGINIGGWKEDGADITAGNDSLYMQNDCGLSGVDPCSTYSNAPGPTNEAGEDKTAIFSLDHKGFSLLAQWLEDGSGDHFGINEALPPDDKRIVTEYKYRNIQARQHIALGTGLDSEFHVGWWQNEEVKDDLYAGNYTGTPFVVDSYYKEKRLNTGVDLTWSDIIQHHVLLSYAYSEVTVEDIEQSFGPLGGAMTAFDSVIARDTSRRINSLTLQDEYRPIEPLTITAGLRYDDYSDIGTSSTPRVAAVWRLSRQHILKAQYAEAFRPPTFYELGGSIGPIDPSTIKTYEAGYIYKGLANDIRLTLFRSHLDNLIIFYDNLVDPWASGFTNAEGATLYGAEVEWEYRLNKDFDIDTNLSYLQSKDENTGASIAGSSDWLGNFDLNYHPGSNMLLNLHYRYVGSVYRELSDSRSDLKSYTSLDTTLNLLNLWRKGLTLRFGVTNLMDAQIRYPAPSDSYADDRPRAGRQWWSNLTYRF